VTDIDDILEAVELPEDAVGLCLKASLVAKFHDLEGQLEMAREKSKSGSLVGNPEVMALAEQVEAVREEMRQQTTLIKLRALPKRAWQTLVEKHPARDGVDPADYNTDTFPLAALSACAIEPKISIEKAGMLIDRLSAGQWSKLWTAVMSLNVYEVDIPFSATASAVLRASPRN
jgi:hypothetical protein